MTIEKRKTRDELMIRFDEDGNFQGAHVIDAVRFIDTETGEASEPKLTDARPVTKAEFGTLIGATNAKLIEAASAEKQRADAAEARVAELEAALAEAEARATAAEQRLVQIAAVAAET